MRYCTKPLRQAFIQLNVCLVIAWASAAAAESAVEPPASDGSNPATTKPAPSEEGASENEAWDESDSASSPNGRRGSGRIGPGWGPPEGRERGPVGSEGRGRGPTRQHGEEYAGRDGRGDRMGRGDRSRMPFFMDRIIPLIEKDHPDLAKRLREIRDQAPEQFERLVADALALRFEGALRRYEAGQFGDLPWTRPERVSRPPMPPGPRPPIGWDEHGAPPERDILENVIELQKRDAELDRRTVELAEKYRNLPQKQDSELVNQRAELRQKLRVMIAEHFELRTELRRMELRRIELELGRLKEAVERIQSDLDKRETARSTILERRVEQLIGEQEPGAQTP